MNASTQKKMTDGTRGSRGTGQVNRAMLTSVMGVLTAILFAASSQAVTNVIVSEDFGGSGDPLNGTTADTFDSAITDAGGSSEWVAGASYTDDGDMYGLSRAYLSLGSYINDVKGSADGKFILSATFAGPANSSWQSFGFFESSSPAENHFVNVGGMATLIYRDNGELDGFGGIGSANAVDGDVVSGSQLLTVVLDLTPDGGYNGVDNFGTVTFLDGDFDTGDPIKAAVGPTTYTYTSAQSFGSMGLSGAQGALEGTIENLELRQITEESMASATVIISDNNVNENLTVGSAAGSLNVVNTNGTFTFSLVETGSFPDNTSFTLGGGNSSNVLTAAVFDYEAQTNYSIRVLATETGGGGLLLTNTFSITVNDIVEAWGGVYAEAEVQVDTTLVGTLKSVAGQNTSVSYATEGTNFDEALFDITGANLSFLAAPTEIGDEYFVNVKATGNPDGDTNTMLIKVTVVFGVVDGTVFKFR